MIKIFDLAQVPEEEIFARQETAADVSGPVADILRDVKARDEKDSSRSAAPLRQAEDAVPADTTHLDLEQSLALLIRIAKEQLQA